MYRLIDIRACLDGVIPTVLATAAVDGTPNISALSDICYVDDRHVALSFQFFNKTRANILANPQALLQVTDPDNGSRFQLRARYLRTETSGALFERMKARLAGIASHVGMSKVFRLRGADVYEVLEIDCVGGPGPEPRLRSDLLGALRACSDRLGDCADLTTLLDVTMSCLADALGFAHALVLLDSSDQHRLFTVASQGYAASGIGAEIGYGEGIIGVAAESAAPIRITHMAQDYLYSSRVRSAYLAANPALDLERRIPLPGLAESRSQLAVPVRDSSCTIGVIYVERTADSSISFEEEDALVIFAAQFAARYASVLREEDGARPISPPYTAATPPTGPALRVRHDPLDHSVFVDDEYLIKGVAGAILWRLLQEYTARGRTEFSNRELRRDPTLGLPEIADNLEARLVLLERRLAERYVALRLVRIGRGRHRLDVQRPVVLENLL